MVTVLHLMLKRFHHFTELKKNFGNQTSLAQSISYNTITVQVILQSIRDLQSYRPMNIQNIARGNFKEQSFNVLQEKLNLANVRNISIYQPLMYIAFGLQKKPRVLCKLFLYTRPWPLNFWLSLPVFDVYSQKAVQGVSRKTTPTIFSFLRK